MEVVDKGSSQGGIESENAPDTPAKPADTLWSKAFSLGKMDEARISELIADASKNWDSLPSWNAQIQNSDAWSGPRSESMSIHGRVLLLDKCEEVKAADVKSTQTACEHVQSFRVSDLEKNNSRYELED